MQAKGTQDMKPGGCRCPDVALAFLWSFLSHQGQEAEQGRPHKAAGLLLAPSIEPPSTQGALFPTGLDSLPLLSLASTCGQSQPYNTDGTEDDQVFRGDQVPSA